MLASHSTACGGGVGGKGNAPAKTAGDKPTNGVTHLPGAFRDGGRGESLGSWGWLQVLRICGKGEIWDEGHFSTVNLFPFRSLVFLLQLHSAPHHPNRPVSTPRRLPHLPEIQPPSPPQEEVLPRHIQGCPTTRGPSRCSRPCTQHKNIQSPPILQPPNSPAFSSPGGKYPAW